MNIRARVLLATLVAVVSSSTAGGAKADAPASAAIRGACDVAFLATSTLHDVSGSARCQPFTVRIARDASGKEVIPSVEVDVPVASMDTRNKSRDVKMREMFQSERFPRIHAAARDVDVERLRVEIGKGREGIASIDLLLRIREVERKIRATASNLTESGDRVTFDLAFPVSLGEFDLKAPSVLGIIRVGDKVSVKATFTLTVSRSP
ncbi:MAG TPA: YceI family protein [Candidatus Deferrimicrobium sp.]|nr:YceI family protein [Candidatus Deferrimicrobium sp.]